MVAADSFVLPVAAVRVSISALVNLRIHPWFPAYLHLRQQAARQGTTVGITPNWASLGELLEVPGGPYGRPYFRPFWNKGSNRDQVWLNPNLAGSYAPSSIREVPKRVIDTTAEGKFSLRERHWVLARENLTDEKRVPALPLAGFFLRDFAVLAAKLPNERDLMDLFLTQFGYAFPQDSEEVEHLFDREWNEYDGDWLEPFKETSQT